MNEGLQQIIALLAVAMMVAMAARRLRLPFTVGLVLVGALLALSGAPHLPALTSELIYFLILPPLLFEAALTLRWRELKRDLPPILLLSILGTLIAAGFTAWAMMAFLDLPLGSALVFAALISATDPVAIVAMFKDNRIEGRLRLLVEGESLFNDAAAAVLFALALAFARTGGADLVGWDVARSWALIVGGGALVGLLTGVATIFASRGTPEHLVELTLTAIAAFGAFLVAEHFHFSGVLATVIAGLVVGNYRSGDYLSAKTQESLGDFWEFAAFLANSLIFLLMGAQIAALPYPRYKWTLFAIVLVVTLAARALTVYPLSLLFCASRWKISWGEQHVLWWGGLRGALALALVLSLPASLPKRDEIEIVTFAVVAFSIVVQGSTMPLLLRRLGFLGIS